MLKSDKSTDELKKTSSLTYENNLFMNKDEFGNVFNLFLTSLKPISISTESESKRYINDTFRFLKREGKFGNSSKMFSFTKTTPEIVKKILKNLDNSSSPGISGKPTKILKLENNFLIPILTSLFNNCITTNNIPTEWKTAVGKGNLNDLNNYRIFSYLLIIFDP